MKSNYTTYKIVFLLLVLALVQMNRSFAQEDALNYNIAIVTKPPDTICVGDAIVITGQASGPPPYTYPNPRWTGTAAPFLSPLNTTITLFTAVVPGVFNAIYSNYDCFGNLHSMTRKIVVDVLQPLNIVSPVGGVASVYSNTPIALMVSGATEYYWYKNDCSGGTYENNYFATGSSVIVTPISPGPCKYKVEGFGPLGCTTNPSFVEFTITILSDDAKGKVQTTNDLGNNIKLQLYPNPTTGIVAYKLGDYSGSLIINIKNLQGQTISSTISDVKAAQFTGSIDLTAYPDGIYFIQLITDKSSGIHKVVKQ